MAETINLYNTRSMLAAVEEFKAPQTFLLNKFFPEIFEADTKAVDIDIYKGKRRVASYVSRRAEGENVERTAFKTVSYIPPYLKPKMTTTVDNILRRSRGEVLYSGNISAQERAAVQMGQDFNELNNMITRAEEIQAKEALFDGVITIKDIDGNTLGSTIDFSRDSDLTVTLTGTDLWSNTASDPIANLRTWKRLVMQKSGLMPNIAVFGSSVVDEFLNNTAVQAYLDKRRFPENARIAMENDASALGAVYIGTIENIDIYSYDEWYLTEYDTDTAGDREEQTLIPINKVLIGSTRARATRLYGVIENVSNVVAAQRFPTTWEENDPSARYLQLHSAPLMATHQPDAYCVATVV